MKGIIIGSAIILFLILAVIWLTRNMMKQSKKDWETLYDLQNKSKTVKTKSEIEAFHKEFVEKSNEINNDLITPHLMKLDGYLRGLHKQFETN